jgi:hypothetical protein
LPLIWLDQLDCHVQGLAAPNNFIFKKSLSSI